MPKIPRISLEGGGAAIPGGEPISPGEVAAPFAQLTNLAGVAFDISTAEGKRQADEMRAALETKQAIVNEVEAGRRAGDYEEELFGYVESIKKEFWESPDKAPDQLLEAGRVLQDRQRESAPNTQVSLDFVQKSNLRLSAAVREMHAWVSDRQSQKAKGDLSTIINRATAGAESVGSVQGLGAYIAAKEAALAPLFEKVLGSGAQAKMADMRAGMARSWVRAQDSSAGALMALEALNETKPGHPLVDNLNDIERESLRKDAAASFAGSFKTRLLDEVKKGASQNRELFDITMADPQNAGKAIIATQNALEEQYVAVKVQHKIDVATLEKYGINLSGYTAEEIPELITDRIRYVKALDYARRNMIGLDAEDDPTSLSGAVVRTNKLLNSGGGKNLTNIVKQEADITKLYSDKKLSTASFMALFKSISLALTPALAGAEDPWGPDKVRAWFSPRIEGDTRLNAEFNRLAGLRNNTVLQDKIRIRYYSQINASLERGVVLESEEAREMAMRALEYEVARDALNRIQK